jgi:cell division protein FtsB
MSRGRILALVAVAGGLTFGFAGGEYGTLDWWQLKGEIRSEQTILDSLKIEIDSLTKAVQALEHDPATQERVARERFGMIRPGELLFIVEEKPEDR